MSLQLNIEHMKRSRKVEGKHENKIINKLIPYFKNRNYQVVPHTRFNVMFSTIISDIDILLCKDNKLTYIEVKSKKDKLRRAENQIINVMPFIDFAYVATDYKPKKFTLHESDLLKDVGLIIVTDKINIEKKAKPLRYNQIGISTLYDLKKDCLRRFAGITSILHTPNYTKEKLIAMIMKKHTRDLKLKVQAIVTCPLEECDREKCPTWKIIGSHNTTLELKKPKQFTLNVREN